MNELLHCIAKAFAFNFNLYVFWRIFPYRKDYRLYDELRILLIATLIVAMIIYFLKKNNINI